MENIGGQFSQNRLKMTKTDWEMTKTDWEMTKK